MAFEKALELLRKEFKPPYRDCVIIRVKINVENIGLFDSIVENSGRCCLPSTEKANHGEINLFVTPHLKEETLKNIKEEIEGFYDKEKLLLKEIKEKEKKIEAHLVKLKEFSSVDWESLENILKKIVEKKKEKIIKTRHVIADRHSEQGSWVVRKIQSLGLMFSL